MAFGKQREIDDLTAQLAEARQNHYNISLERDQLRTELRLARAAHTLVGIIEPAITEFYNDPNIIELATDRAEAAVIKSERRRIIEEIANRIAKEHGDEYAADYRVNQGPNIRGKLDALFKVDGTYELAETDARTKVHTEIQNDLIKERKAIIEQELSTPETKAAFIAEIMDTVLDSPELKKFRRETRDGLESKWTAEATDDAKTQITAEETARESGFKSEFTDSYLRGREGMRVRRDKRDALERKWRGEELPIIAERIEDEELKDLLQKRAEQEKKHLRAEVHGRELLGQFEGTGINMQEVDSGTRVELYLGTIEKAREDPYSYSSTPSPQRGELACARKISLIAQGDGHFIVDEDTLALANSEYERDNSLEHGMVAMFGRKVTENGVSRLDPRISADVRLYYDTNTTNPEITDAYLPVANVVMNGISARLIGKVRLPK